MCQSKFISGNRLWAARGYGTPAPDLDQEGKQATVEGHKGELEVAHRPWEAY